MDVNLKTRIRALYDHMFNMYEKLLAIAYGLIDLDNFQNTHCGHNQELDPLSALFSGLSLPDDATNSGPQLPEAALGDPAQYVKDQVARIKRNFGARSTEVKRTRKSYKELQVAFTTPGILQDEGIRGAQRKLAGIMDTVDAFHNTIEEYLLREY